MPARFRRTAAADYAPSKAGPDRTCADNLDFTSLPADEFPAGWLRPGRTVVEEQFDAGNRTAVHVSLDSGVTWQRIRVSDGGSIPEVLRQLG